MTPAERLRKHQRALEKTQRELDRERIKLENQEKKLVADIKKSAKNGQIGACKVQAKDDAGYEGCYWFAGKHESTDEPACLAKNSNGV